MIISDSRPAESGDLSSAAAWLESCGFPPETIEDAAFDGRISRAPHECAPRKSSAGWFVLGEDPVPHGFAGCWRCGVEKEWIGTPGGALTDEQRKRIQQLTREREKAEETEREAIAAKLEGRFKELDLAPTSHPYLVAKGIQPHGAMIHDGALILPLQDAAGKIWSAQGIDVKPRKSWGGISKSFEKGARMHGVFYPIGRLDSAERIIVCEGFATGATLHEATGTAVACAMSANNLKAVGAALHAAFPKAALVIAGDNDRATPGNPGAEAAETAALGLNCGFVVPDFGDIPPASDATDFNDLARLRGIGAVTESIAAVVPPERPPVVYDAGRASWWVRTIRGDFVITGESGAKRQLKVNGVEARQPKDETSSPLEREMARQVTEESVDYAGPVAGWPVGRVIMGGRRVLVTSSTEVEPPGPGDCYTLHDLFRGMLGDDQFRRVLLWLHCARRRITTRRWHPLPALALVGPKSCGKSFLQHITTQLLGGRSAKPAQYLQGVTPFNGDLFGAEHLVFEDESAKTDSASRRHLGEQIKALLFCRQVQCHGKHRQAITLEPTWALSLSINDEPEHLMVLPKIDDSLSDKVLLVQCEHHARPVPDDKEETEWLRGVVAAEIRSFADMVDRVLPVDMPPEILNPRTVVAGWQNRSVLTQMADLAPESQLLSLIDDTLFSGPIPHDWTGTAEQLSRQLRSGDYAHEVSRLLTWPAACGTYLRRISADKPTRVQRVESRTREDGRARRWIISPPTT